MESPFKFDVTFENGSYKIKNGRDLCLAFKFIEDEDDDDGTVLYISKIVKCGDGKYTREVIKMIETMAKTIPDPPWSLVKYIKLEDGSSINVCAGQNSSGMNIDLRYLKILTTGESWYNSFGYKSLDHDANVAHNAGIINQPMDWLLSELVVQEYIDQKYINKFKARFPELNTADLTVKEYVTAMTKAVPRSGTRTCTKEQEKRASLLFNLVYYIGMSEMLEYDFRLQKKVERGPSPKASPRASPKASPKASPRTSPKASPRTSPKVLPSDDAPLVICEHLKHPMGYYGCFRCMDSELLQKLSSMFDKNNVDVFSVVVLKGATYKGPEATKPNSKQFFTFLHENNICFKIFFTPTDFMKEYINVKILKTIPSEQAVEVGEQAIAGEQSNFLQKFTTYYEHQYETDAGAQKSFAFVLEFKDNVQILKEGRSGDIERIYTKRIYIILNKFCNNKITKEQKTSKQFHDEILGALEILNSHGYGHDDAHLGNVVDCGELSEPRYKLIDFGDMIRTEQYYKNAHSDKFFFEFRIKELSKSGGTKRSAKRSTNRIRSAKRSAKRKRSRSRSAKRSTNRSRSAKRSTNRSAKRSRSAKR